VDHIIKLVLLALIIFNNLCVYISPNGRNEKNLNGENLNSNFRHLLAFP